MNGRVQSRRVKGQSAVMVSLLMMIVVMLIAFTTNLGKLVTEKIAMQNAVDLAVYSGAATQAGYMNKLREVNNNIWKIHNQTRDYLDDSETSGWDAPQFFFGPVAYCGIGPDQVPFPIGKAAGAEARIALAKMDIERQTFQFKKVNGMAPSKVEEATRTAANENYEGTGGKVQFKSPMQSGGGLVPVAQKPIEWSYKPWGIVSICPKKVCAFCGEKVGGNIVEQTTADSWFFRKSTPGEIMVAAGIENATPDSPFLDGGYLGQFFAGNCSYRNDGNGKRCALNVYAAAHPHHGKLGSVHPSEGGQASWEQMWDIRTNDPNRMSVDMKDPLDDHKVFGGNYYDYKVRFIGIFETDAGVLGGTRLRDAIGDYGPRMQH